MCTGAPGSTRFGLNFDLFFCIQNIKVRTLVWIKYLSVQLSRSFFHYSYNIKLLICIRAYLEVTDEDLSSFCQPKSGMKGENIRMSFTCWNYKNTFTLTYVLLLFQPCFEGKYFETFYSHINTSITWSLTWKTSDRLPTNGFS